MADELQEQAIADDRERKAAEAKFKKSERATEGAQAMSLTLSAKPSVPRPRG